MTSETSIPTKTGVSEPKSNMAGSPMLSRRGLTVLLSLMCLVPIITIIWLWQTLPPVQPGKLPAAIFFKDVPPPSFYALSTNERVPHPMASIVVRNTGKESWTHINVRINRDFQVHEHDFTIEPGQERGFYLDRFVSRKGDIFDVRYLRIRHIEVYARLPDGSRETFVEILD